MRIYSDSEIKKSTYSYSRCSKIKKFTIDYKACLVLKKTKDLVKKEEKKKISSKQEKLEKYLFKIPPPFRKE